MFSQVSVCPWWGCVSQHAMGRAGVCPWGIYPGGVHPETQRQIPPSGPEADPPPRDDH